MSQIVRRSRQGINARILRSVALVASLSLPAGISLAAALTGSALPACAAAGMVREASLDVSDLVGMALGSHPAIVAKRGEVVAAEADLSSARWQYFPTPSISLGHDQKGVSSSTLALQQPLWAGGRLDAGVDYANARTVAAVRSVTDAQHTLALAVTDSYQAWLQSRGRQAVLQRSLTFHEERKASMQRRVASGASAEVDSDLVASRLALVKSDLEASRSGVRTSVARLSQAVGCHLSEDSLALAEAGSGASVASLENVLADAELSFPLLRKHDADIEAAEHLVSVKRASRWPTLNLRAENVRADAVAGSGVAAVNDNRILLVFQFVPGAGFSAAADIDAASARVGALRAMKEAARRDLHDRVVGEYENHRAAASRRHELLDNRKASAQVLESYSRLFAAGKRSWLDVLNAARELTQSELSVADAEATMMAAAYKLRLYSGSSGWYGTPVMDATR